ncbi:uncharacterized protein [Antedon mediterranea]|uniref:uncharacterized protein n=1 Tax=Antedon mediterranea TaxID=105859 RepID=UPI003AF6D9F8
MGADIKLLPELHAAIWTGQYQDVRTIIDTGCDVNTRDPQKRTALITCCFIEQEDWAVGIARMLLEKEAKIGLTDRNGRNALIHACIYQRNKLISLFLKAIDYDLDHRDCYGNTALFYAASCGNVKITTALIEKMLTFKLMIDQLNKWGMSALMEASRQGHTHCCDILFTKGEASKDLRDSVCGKTAGEWLLEHKRLQQLPTELFIPRRNLSRRTHQSTIHSKTFPTMLIRSETQIEMKTFSYDGLNPREVRPSTGVRRHTARKVSNRVRMEYVQRNWIQEAIGDNIISTRFKTCLYTTPTDDITEMPLALPRINNCWRQDFGKLCKRFEVVVSSSYKRKAIPRTVESLTPPPDPPRLIRRHTSHSLNEFIKSNRRNVSESAETSTKVSSKSRSEFGSNHQLKSKREDDSTSGAARKLMSVVRRRNLRETNNSTINNTNK